jgi:hypothetical protein
MLKKWLYRFVSSMVPALAAAVLLAGAALAGGVVVSLDAAPPDLAPGTPFTVGFTILSAHDGSSQNGMEPIITLTNAATGEKVVVTARAEGEAGHYVAGITLPSAGQWDWEIQPLGKYAENYPASVMVPIQALEAAASVPANGGAAAPAPAMGKITTQTVSLLLLAGSALALLAAFVTRFVPRQRAVTR